MINFNLREFSNSKNLIANPMIFALYLCLINFLYLIFKVAQWYCFDRNILRLKKLIIMKMFHRVIFFTCLLNRKAWQWLLYNHQHSRCWNCFCSRDYICGKKFIIRILSCDYRGREVWRSVVGDLKMQKSWCCCHLILKAWEPEKLKLWL
jgi:hypothetical protein